VALTPEGDKLGIALGLAPILAVPMEAWIRASSPRRPRRASQRRADAGDSQDGRAEFGHDADPFRALLAQGVEIVVSYALP
jgi:hypothetical protein